MTLPRIGADAELNLDKWSANVQDMISDATKVDNALNDLVQQANKTEAALNSMGGQSGEIDISVDASEIQTAIGLKDMLDDPTSFIANANDADILSAINLQDELEQNTSFVASVNDSEINAAIRLQDDLDSNTSFRANVDDAELTSAKRKHDDLDTNTNVTVNVDDQEVDNTLAKIRDMQAVQLGLSVKDEVGGVVGGLLDFTGIPGLFELNDVLGDVEGRTGQIIPNLETIINQLYSEAWGESRTQIAGIVTQATQLGVSYEDLEDATRRAFALSDILGKEPDEVMEAMTRMVEFGIAPDMATAADIMTTTFQQGGDAGEDMLDTLVEYAPDFAKLGVTGETAGAAIVSGMSAGFMASDFAGDSLKEFGVQIDEWARDKESHPIFEELNLWDETAAYNAGEMGFSEYMTAIRDALNGLPEEERNAAFVEIFGTPSEPIANEWETWLNGMIDGFGEDWEGAMDRASAAVEGDLSTSFTSLKRTVEVEFGELLNNVFDVDAFIEDLRVRLSTFMGEIGSGSTLGEATETAFGGTLIGDIINGIETVQEAFTDMIIGILQGVEGVIKIFDPGAAADIRGAIADLAEFQLGVDIFTAESYEQIAHDIGVALERGVSEADVGQMISDNLEQITSSGDFAGGFDFINTLLQEGTISQETHTQLVGQIRETMGTAITSAFETGDFSLIADDNFLANMVRPEPLATALRTAFETGFDDVDDLLAAWDIAENLGNALTGGESTGLRAVAQAIPGEIDLMFDEMESVFNQAIESGDLDLATRIAETTNIPTFQSKVDELIAAAESSEQPIDDTLQTSEDNTEDFATAVDEAATDVDTSSVHVKNAYDTMGVASGNAKKNVKANTDAMADDVETAATDMTTAGTDMETAFDDVGTASGELMKAMVTHSETIMKSMDLMTDSANIYKMTAIEAFRTAGDEYSLLAGRIAIDTESILGTLELTMMQIAELGSTSISIPVAGGGNSTVNNSTNISVSNTINTNSQASAISAGNAASQIRGH